MSGAGAEHSHGHLSVWMDGLADCVDRAHATVSASLKRIGVEDSDEAEQASSPPSDSKMSMLGRLGSRLSSAGGGGGEAEGDQGLMGVQFGDNDGGAGGGLYLSAS